MTLSDGGDDMDNGRDEDRRQETAEVLEHILVRDAELLDRLRDA